MASSSSSPESRPSPDLAELAVRVIGNEINKAILRSLSRAARPELGLLFIELTEAIVSEMPTGAARGTAVWRHLKELEDAGVVVGSVPRDERKGRSVQYRIDAARLEEIYASSLAYALGKSD